MIFLPRWCYIHYIRLGNGNIAIATIVDIVTCKKANNENYDKGSYANQPCLRLTLFVKNFANKRLSFGFGFILV